MREAAGDRFDHLEFGTYYSGRSAIVEDARAFLTRRREEAIERGVTPKHEVEEALRSPLALFGTIDELVERIVKNREQYRLSYLVFHDDEIESFAPIVQQLAGT